MNPQDGKPREANKTSHMTFIEDQNHCVLCNTELEIKVEVINQESKVRESAHCHRCGIKTRIKDHLVH